MFKFYGGTAQAGLGTEKRNTYILWIAYDAYMHPFNEYLVPLALITFLEWLGCSYDAAAKYDAQPEWKKDIIPGYLMPGHESIGSLRVLEQCDLGAREHAQEQMLELPSAFLWIVFTRC